MIRACGPELDEVLAAFESACLGSSVPPVEKYLPQGASDELLVELVRVHMEASASRRSLAELEDYLTRFPRLRRPDLLALAAFEDYRQRLLLGELVSSSEYALRYALDTSDWPTEGDRSALDAAPVLLAPTRLVADLSDPAKAASVSVSVWQEGAAVAPDWPEAGQTFLGFDLVGELGRGAFGRVFLARQRDLSDRLVALKISTELEAEVRRLARLQHTNIVPVYSVHRAASMQALCMPFFGATTLARVLADLQRSDSPPSSGRHLVQSLLARRSNQGEALPARGAGEPGLLERLQSLNFADAVLSLASQLAGALEHAHERGLVHQDLKPANVLLTDAGVPMLLDFNLAGEKSEQRARIGGTLPYMSPEQLRGLAGEKVEVDGRSDVYSLGVMLFQMLTLKFPFLIRSASVRESLLLMLADRAAPVAVRPIVPALPGGVEAIVARCLAPAVEDRYPSAAAVKEDIDRHLANLPLRHVQEPIRERAVKFRRRHPGAFSPLSLALALSAMLFLVGTLGVRASLQEQARQREERRASAVLGLEEFLGAAEKTRVAAIAGDNAEAIRLSLLALDQYEALSPGWRERPAVQLLSETDRLRLDDEIGELTFTVLRATALAKDASRVASLTRLLNEASLTPSRASFRAAVEHAAAGRFRAALPQVTSFVTEHPKDFSGWYLKGRCHEQIDQPEAAMTAYGIGIGLRPRYARTWFARGRLLSSRHRELDLALADLDQALTLEPDLNDARLLRAMVLHAQGKNEEAKTDLDRLLDTDQSAVRARLTRSQVRAALKDVEGAKADLKEGLFREPTDALGWVARGLALLEENKTQEALADFRKAEQLDPRCEAALVNQTYVLGDVLGKAPEAIAVADRLLAFHPDHLNARAGRAVLLARIGRNAEALAEADKCQKASPHPQTTYQIACVYALVAKTDRSQRTQAVRLVSQALLGGYGWKQVLTDRDLASLADHPAFARMAETVREMQRSALDQAPSDSSR